MEQPLNVDDYLKFYRDEITDRNFYLKLSERVSDPDFRENLVRLARVEDEHLGFWRERLESKGIDTSKIRPHTLKIVFLLTALKFIGIFLTVRLLEHGEINSIRAYRNALDSRIEDEEVRTGLEKIISDEIEHEEIFEHQISKGEDKVQRNQDVIYGISDGFIEVLGSMSGLVAVFTSRLYIALGGLVVALSGSMSMMLGAYLSSKSKTDFHVMEIQRKALFRVGDREHEEIGKMKQVSRKTASTVGLFYLMGSAVPILPYLVLTDKTNALIISIALVGIAQAIANAIIALSMNTRIVRAALRASLLSLGVATGTFLVGLAFHLVFGVTIG